MFLSNFKKTEKYSFYIYVNMEGEKLSKKL